MCETAPDVLYATVAGPSGRLSGFKTVDGASSWKPLAPPADTKLWDSQPVAVNPSDPNTVFIGGDVLYRSRDGGQTWERVTCCPTTFGDHRAVAFSADGRSLYVGSDGGVFATIDSRADRVAWTALNDTLNTVLFYP